jgi:hypothetical protein
MLYLTYSRSRNITKSPIDQGVSAVPLPFGRREGAVAPLAPADVNLFSCQRSEARRTARQVTSRGRKKYLGSLPECRKATDQEVCPTYSIQEGKKGIGGLIIVFTEIRPVTGFGGEL